MTRLLVNASLHSPQSLILQHDISEEGQKLVSNLQRNMKIAWICPCARGLCGTQDKRPLWSEHLCLVPMPVLHKDWKPQVPSGVSAVDCREKGEKFHRM